MPSTKCFLKQAAAFGWKRHHTDLNRRSLCLQLILKHLMFGEDWETHSQTVTWVGFLYSQLESSESTVFVLLALPSV